MFGGVHYWMLWPNSTPWPSKLLDCEIVKLQSHIFLKYWPNRLKYWHHNLRFWCPEQEPHSRAIWKVVPVAVLQIHRDKGKVTLSNYRHFPLKQFWKFAHRNIAKNILSQNPGRKNSRCNHFHENLKQKIKIFVYLDPCDLEN